MSRTIRPLPNLGTVREVFARVRHRHGAILLESSAIMTGLGRWSYIITDPAATLEARGGETTFRDETWSDPFTALETRFSGRIRRISRIRPRTAPRANT
jgi:anthranilate/para-aminobenzoate synthase component I